MSAIATGRHPDGSYIPGLTWYRRGEGRFVEYGSSFSATLVEGSHAAINDSILNLNHLHLSSNVETIFERIEDAGLRGRGDQLLRVPRPHPAPAEAPTVAALARRIGVFDAAYGPKRFYFGELFASDRTGAPPNLGVHAANDVHAAAIGRWLVARDGFDFLLYYLPDVDMAQHRVGPQGALDAVAIADRSIASLIDAGGGLDRFSSATGSCCSPTTARPRRATACDVRPALADLRLFAGSIRSVPGDTQVAVAASNRICMLYRLAEAPDAARELAGRVVALDGVDLAAFVEDGDAVVLREAASCGSVAAARLRDRRGTRWTVTGDHAALGLVHGRRRGRRARLSERARAARLPAASA